ncbi:MAG: hypothetical protein RBR97_01505 [Bacteroidales bacterium]|nr:hypothetical protein [Bacteroidales bacterium]
MKKNILTILLIIFVSISVFAQSPEKLSYQAVIRDNISQLVVNQEIAIQITILRDSENGSAGYVETQEPITNDNGLISLEIGMGVVLEGNFENIEWQDGAYFLKTEVDLAGGSDYSITGTSQLLSVPYAMHSKTTESILGTITESQIADLQNYLTEEADGNIYNEIQDLSMVLNEDNDANNQKIINVSDPTNPQDVATKAYVDLLKIQIENLENYITSDLTIGNYYGGGIVFYILQTGDLGYVETETHGLICDIADLNDAHWADYGCYDSDVNGAEATAIGTGMQNTINIISDCQGESAYLAAELCAISTNAGYTDWFLPSSLELNQMYISSSSINSGALANGGMSFISTPYWSSTEFSNTTAISQYLDDGTSGAEDKEATNNVRAIRVF